MGEPEGGGEVKPPDEARGAQPDDIEEEETAHEETIRFKLPPEISHAELLHYFAISGFVTKSVILIPLLEALHRLSRMPDRRVLLVGETGVGKEKLARYLHDNSPRGSKPFVAVNCGALPESLIESELFGYEKGAFTGATRAKSGLVVRAHGGTLFLDEIGELPFSAQSTLLRVLQERMVMSVGGEETKPVDFRLITATNRNLKAEARAGRFRPDLYYRLGTCLPVPPLRARKEDIPLLIGHFISRSRVRHQISVNPELLAVLMKHDWPGNIRELEEVIGYACDMCEEGKMLGKEHLPPDFTPESLDEAVRRLEVLEEGLRVAYEGGVTQKKLERLYFKFVFEACGENQSRAAKILGISSPTASRRAKELKGNDKGAGI